MDIYTFLSFVSLPTAYCEAARNSTAGIRGGDPVGTLGSIFQKALYDRFHIGNTARPLCIRCAVQIFVRLPKFDAGLLTQVKENLGNMTESWQADDVQRR